MKVSGKDKLSMMNMSWQQIWSEREVNNQNSQWFLSVVCLILFTLLQISRCVCNENVDTFYIVSLKFREGFFLLSWNKTCFLKLSQQDSLRMFWWNRKVFCIFRSFLLFSLAFSFSNFLTSQKGTMEAWQARRKSKRKRSVMDHWFHACNGKNYLRGLKSKRKWDLRHTEREGKRPKLNSVLYC